MCLDTTPLLKASRYISPTVLKIITRDKETYMRVQPKYISPTWTKYIANGQNISRTDKIYREQTKYIANLDKIYREGRALGPSSDTTGRHVRPSPRTDLSLQLTRNHEPLLALTKNDVLSVQGVIKSAFPVLFIIQGHPESRLVSGHWCTAPVYHSTTGITGLNAYLKAPRFEFVSNARPSLFAYRASTKPPKKEVVHKVATAVLSTNAQVKARQKKKAANDHAAMDTFLIHADDKKESDGNVEMKIDEGSASPGKDAGDISPINGSISNLAEDEKPSTSAKSTKKVEPSFEMLPNISRITPAQLAHITFPEGRFQPPQEDTEFIDFEPPAAPEPTPANNLPAEVLPVGPHIALDETSPAGFEKTGHGRDAPQSPVSAAGVPEMSSARRTGQQIERDAPPRSGTMAPLLQHKVPRAETPPEAVNSGVPRADPAARHSGTIAGGLRHSRDSKHLTLDAGTGGSARVRNGCAALPMLILTAYDRS
ncbi:hypothetical protein C8J57DRAFT_1469101 [Mycena rebaudengoi]|nr:hypothetical protein C8J57DRAFT_1469101 [Mycena rebaudengoi]